MRPVTKKTPSKLLASETSHTGEDQSPIGNHPESHTERPVTHGETSHAWGDQSRMERPVTYGETSYK